MTLYGPSYGCARGCFVPPLRMNMYRYLVEVAGLVVLISELVYAVELVLTSLCCVEVVATAQVLLLAFVELEGNHLAV